MEIDAQGFARPIRRDPLQEAVRESSVVNEFRDACPGVGVRAQRPVGSQRHPLLGPVVAVWEAWATDPEIRFAGSSGGTLTALSAWLVETGQASRVVGARANPANARQSVSVRILNRNDAVAAAGSRYAPVSNAAEPTALEPTTAFVGKPCEVSALRALSSSRLGSEEGPILLSFFCAGTPSQYATNRLAASLGVPEDEHIEALRYRGNGWPGAFTIVRSDGSSVATSYDDSWGTHLGPATQWRCKICPDGVGESSDITAADFWRADERGYPAFSDQAGISALIARTARGRDLILRAAAEGVLTLAPMDIDSLAAVQPLQRQRRETLSGRLTGTVVAGGRIPTFRGFGLVRLALPRLRAVYRTAKGAFRRRRAMGRTRLR
ncbi:Coenzyme F420 hydrogenase/dehydrogenase, beta subunit C-terminal domain [Microbacterium sp. STN6]|uniref:Coenzyme F420 hydrogenase/dehydrogenase, beta subunit C-terminal domain n=1 Tax=Microbacterium sp. STN6 TaxID=2995588 RepID=UPI003A59943A